MTGSLFRRLLVLAVALVAITLFAIDRTLVGTEVRGRVFAIGLSSPSLLALLVAFFISRSLARRVSDLKRVAEGILDRPHQPSSDDLGSLEDSLASVAKELRRLLDRLRFESARREAILSSMAEGVLAVDPDLRVTFCNTAFLKAIGFRSASFGKAFRCSNWSATPVFINCCAKCSPRANPSIPLQAPPRFAGARSRCRRRLWPCLHRPRCHCDFLRYYGSRTAGTDSGRGSYKRVA